MKNRWTFLTIAVACLRAALAAADTTVSMESFAGEVGDEIVVYVSVDGPELSGVDMELVFDEPFAFVADSEWWDASRISNVWSPGQQPTAADFFPSSTNPLKVLISNLEEPGGGGWRIAAGSGRLFGFRVRALSPATSTVRVTRVVATNTDELKPVEPTDAVNGRVTAVRLAGKPSDPTSATGATLTLSGGGVTHYRFKLDGTADFSAETVVETPLTLSGLAEGHHTLRILIKDVDGAWQAEDLPIRCDWEINLQVPTNPELVASDPALETPFNPALIAGQQIALTWPANAGDGTRAYVWAVDRNPQTDLGETVMGTAPPAAIAASDLDDGDGAFYLHLRTNSAPDGAGFWSGTSHYGPWDVDTTPPQATLLNPPPALTNTRNPTLSVDSGDVTAYRYDLNGAGFGAETAVTTPIALNLGLLGSHTLRLVGQDSAGNWQAMEEEATIYEWEVDAVAPTIGGGVPVTPAPGATGFTNTGLLTVTDRDPASDTGSGVAGYATVIAGDAGTFPGGSSPDGPTLPAEFQLAGDDGSYYINGFVFDLAGNGAPFSWGPWTLDTIPPSVTITRDPDVDLARAPYQVTVDGGDGSTVEYSLDGGAYSAYTGPVAVSDHGAHTLLARSTDLARNVGTGGPVTFTVGYGIDGTVIYGGEAVGNAVVALATGEREVLGTATVAGGNGAFGFVVGEPGTYGLSAFVDVDGGGTMNGDEPRDLWTQATFPVGADVAGADLYPADWWREETLPRGWNLVTAPLTPLAVVMTELEEMMRGRAWRFDATRRRMVPVTALAARQPVWVYVDGPMPLALRGLTEAVAPTEIRSGWNLVGVSGAVASPVGSDPLIRSGIWSWQGQRYVAAPAGVDLEPWTGYWIYGIGTTQLAP